jgi:predicted NAD/FAD-binding protein
MRIAIVGAGISGIAAAHRLQDSAEVTVFEARRRIGGHTDTHSILVEGRTYSVDSGFIVFNEQNYPEFSAWLTELGVASQPSDMSFGVCNERSGLEYGSRGLAGLFSQRRNLFSPRFLGMLLDLRRFYADAAALKASDDRTLLEFVESQRYGAGFLEDHLAPMCSALWSLPLDSVMDIPIYHVVAFMAHHRMLQLNGRPEWRVVRGGSSSYLDAFASRFSGTIATGDEVLQVERQPGGAIVTTRSGRARFDAVVLACHSDQALSVLHDPSVEEREVLGAIPYQRNRVVVHSDDSVMPGSRSAWSSWNARVNEEDALGCQVTYWMNLLQSLSSEHQFFVTLNPVRHLRDVWSEREYAHPVFTGEARKAQARRAQISGSRSTYFCGAYWGWGFHEDGFASGTAVAAEIMQEAIRAA